MIKDIISLLICLVFFVIVSGKAISNFQFLTDHKTTNAEVISFKEKDKNYPLKKILAVSYHNEYRNVNSVGYVFYKATDAGVPGTVDIMYSKDPNELYVAGQGGISWVKFSFLALIDIVLLVLGKVFSKGILPKNIIAKAKEPGES